MSIEWFRWYHSTVSDPKFSACARKAKQPKSAVIAVWAATLEYASQHEDRGSLEDLDVDTLSACLDLDEEAVDAILAALTAKGLITDGRVAKWDKRQVTREREDDSRERVRRHRERPEGKVTPGNATVTPGNATVTPVTPPRERVDKDIDTEERRGRKEKENNAHARKTACPPDLAITPELQAWATEHGYHEDISQHLDSFRDKATAKGYQYSDWQAALRNAIRDDWAGLRNPSTPKRPAAHGGSRNRISIPQTPQGAEFDAILNSMGRPVIEGEIVHELH